MILISKRKLMIFIIFILFIACIISYFKGNQTSVFSKSVSKCIIIDAGHGLPDGGAVGMNGTIESTLNIKIAKLIEKNLKKKGFDVIMTRKDESSLASGEKTISQSKHADMNKRLEIINSSRADIFVSIHMNKFADSKYSGPQAIYSSNYEESRLLAKCIQEELNTLTENTSKRSELRAPNTIYLLKHAKIPSVITECGFLSNYEEEKLLNSASYQKKISDTITKGIISYYKTIERDL